MKEVKITCPYCEKEIILNQEVEEKIYIMFPISGGHIMKSDLKEAKALAKQEKVPIYKYTLIQ